MIPLPVIFAVVSAVAGASGTYLWQANKYERILSEQRNEYLKRDFKALEVAHADTIRLQAKKDEAEKTHAVRIADLRKSVDATAVIADGLRNELATARAAMPDASCSSIRLHAATLNQVFGLCTSRLERMAEAATGHSADAVMLLEAWPEYNPQLSKSGPASESQKLVR